MIKKKIFFAFFATVMFAVPSFASAAIINLLPSDLPPFGITAALRNSGQAVDIASSTLSPATLTISCDQRAKIQYEVPGGTEKPKKFICRDKNRQLAYYFFPGLSPLRVTLLSSGKPATLHFTLREEAKGGDVDYEAVTLDRN